METSTEPMEPSEQFCPNLACCARGQTGQGNIIIHDHKRQRYRCKSCKQTFSARRGTILEGLRKPLSYSPRDAKFPQRNTCEFSRTLMGRHKQASLTLRWRSCPQFLHHQF